LLVARLHAERKAGSFQIGRNNRLGLGSFDKCSGGMTSSSGGGFGGS
jgi:hypothetical protein